MKLVKERNTDEYMLVSDSEYSNNTNLYINRNDCPIYWNKYGYKLSDSLLVKDNVQRIYNSKSWNDFNLEEKREISKTLIFSISSEIFSTVLSSPEIEYAKEFRTKVARVDRANRWEKLRVTIAPQVSQLVSLQFYTSTKQFKDDYIDAALPHLTCWLTNTSYAPLGIDYTNNGFAQQSYYTTTFAQLAASILIYGNHFVTK